MEANGIRAMAVRMLAARDEGDWARRGIEASCAFIMASAGRYGCSPFAAAACAAMWLGSDAPGYAMAAAILGAAYAKSTMSVFACIMLAGAAMVFGVFKEAHGEETPVCVRIIAPLIAQAVPLCVVHANNRYAFMLGMGALLLTVPLSAVLCRAWGALWAYIRGKRLRRAETAAVIMLCAVVGICAALGGAVAAVIPLLTALMCAFGLCRAGRFATRELSMTRLKLRDAAAVARELAAYSPHSAYMGGIGNAMERISMPSGGRRAYLSAQAGCAAAAMAKSPSNGDAMAIRRVGHELLLILSDGMGSGVAAHRESQCAVAMYGELISIGFGEEDAVRSINELLYSRNTDELYATLDAIRIDLSTGEATILKQSAPPAFLIRNGRIRPLYAEAPPLGILKETSVGIRKTRLSAGDTLVLMTDGLSDALGSGLYAAMQDAVLHADTPESAARTLIARAGGVSVRDDMSAIVARFSSCHKNAQF